MPQIPAAEGIKIIVSPPLAKRRGSKISRFPQKETVVQYCAALLACELRLLAEFSRQTFEVPFHEGGVANDVF